MSQAPEFFNYVVYVQAQGSDIEIVEGSDPRPPAEVRAAWLKATRVYLERGWRAERAGMLANMRNQALGKKVEDGLADVTLEDVEAPPENYASADEQLCLAGRGREDGAGYVSVWARLVVGVACRGRGPLYAIVA